MAAVGGAGGRGKNTESLYNKDRVNTLRDRGGNSRGREEGPQPREYLLPPPQPQLNLEEGMGEVAQAEAAEGEKPVMPQSATANHPTHVLVELTDSSGRPCSLQQNVTAELQAQGKSPAISAAVAVISLSRYEVSCTAVSRGQHKLHIRVSQEISGSPFTMTVYIP